MMRPPASLQDTIITHSPWATDQEEHQQLSLVDQAGNLPGINYSLKQLL